MHTINILEWDLTYTDLVNWIQDREANVYAVSFYGAGAPSTQYKFENDEDFVAFKLAFRKEK